MAVSRMAESYTRHVQDGASDWFGIEARLIGKADQPAIAEGFTVVASGLLHKFYLEFADAFNQCESPIEELMFLALWGTGLQDSNVFFRSSRWLEDEIRGVGRMDESHFVIKPQAAIDMYRVDFLIEYKHFEMLTSQGNERSFRSRCVSTSSMVVECDGHDFHEKTKDQAARDKTRDRELSKLGYKVFHYTGSEIWNDAYRCAKEALDELMTMAEGS